MVLWGSIVNALAIVVGAFVGTRVRLGDRIRQTIMQGLGLAVVLIGVSMGLKTENVLIPIASLVLGGIVGELIDVEKRISQVGSILQKMNRKNSQGDFVQGFLTATLVYCIGAMAILGALDSGLKNSHDVLYAKAMLDGVSSVFFASSFGIGVLFSALPVFVYQGSISLLATALAPLLQPDVVAELTATGGILIMGIGINILGLAKIAVGNLLPALLFAALASVIF